MPYRYGRKSGVAALSLVVLIATGIWLLNPLFKNSGKIQSTRGDDCRRAAGGTRCGLFNGAGRSVYGDGCVSGGVLLSESDFRHQLEADIEPFRGLLLGLFFLAVGMSLDVATVLNNWKVILSATVLMIILKCFAIYGVARFTKASHHTAIHRAVLMSQGGEFAFVLLASRCRTTGD